MALLALGALGLVARVGAVPDAVADGVAVDAGTVVAAKGQGTALGTAGPVALGARLVRAVAAVEAAVAERLRRYALVVAAAELQGSAGVCGWKILIFGKDFASWEFIVCTLEDGCIEIRVLVRDG